VAENQIRAVALDFDGTVKPNNGNVDPRLLDYLKALRRIDVTLLLVTGRCVRELEELVSLSLFDAVVAENGAVLLVGGQKTFFASANWYATREALLKYLRPGCEEVIVSAERAVLPKLKRLLNPDEAKIELNKDRVMVLPPGVDKASGLMAALRRLGVDADSLMCVGDAENDVSMLKLGRVKVAVRNAVDRLKAEADYVTQAEDGAGVLEALEKQFAGTGSTRLA
jgi:hydroxymethylpyrimidine pyrophosphatase-like HAD family hydrolase